MIENNNNECKILPLSDCLEYITRGVAPKYVTHSPISALNQKAIRWGYIETNHLKYHDPNKIIREDVYIRKGDIVINSTGDITIGRAYYFKRDWPNLFADSHVTILRLNRDILLPEFCIYLFPTQEYQTKIYGLVTGTTGQLELSKNNLRKLKVLVPPLPTQRKIAAILSAYDDLIENNTRRIRILEEMAQTIYQEWFVKFHFPGHEGVKMVDSPLGLIPEGWEVKELKEIVEIFRGRSYLSVDLANKGGLPFLNLKCIDRDGGFRRSGLKRYMGVYKASHIAKKGDIIIAVTDMTQERRIVAHAALVPTLDKGYGICSMDIIRIEPKQQMLKLFLYGLLRYSSFSDEVKQHANGVNVLHLAPERITDFQFSAPPAYLMRGFADLVSPIMEQIDNLENKNEILRRTRDLLLPKLISGEVDVETLAFETPVNKS